MSVFRITAFACVLMFVGLSVGAFRIVDLAGVGSPDIIRGLTIEEQGSHIRISGRHLDCESSTAGEVSASCQAEILGEPMRVDVVRHPLNHFTYSDCHVTYRGSTSHCYAKTYTMTSEPDATVTGLGLTTEELATLRQEHRLSSRWEQDWRSDVPLVASLVAACSVLVTLCSLPARWRYRLPLTAAFGVVAFAVTYAAAIALLLSSQLID